MSTDDELKGESLEDFLGEPSAEEIAEADAMMRALERDHHAENLDQASYGIAAMLQFAPLSEDESAQAWTETLKGVSAHIERTSPKAETPSWLRWFLPAMSVAAAVALLLYAVRVDRMQVATIVPQVNVQVLNSQLAVAKGAPIKEMDTPMASYRSKVLASMKQRYRR